jgi:hypothetical protein
VITIGDESLVAMAKGMRLCGVHPNAHGMWRGYQYFTVRTVRGSAERSRRLATARARMNAPTTHAMRAGKNFMRTRRRMVPTRR